VSSRGSGTPEDQQCKEETAGYDGMFGVYCVLPAGHLGPHNDGHVEWDFVDLEFRNSADPPAQSPEIGS